jgi:hypothetical protein
VTTLLVEWDDRLPWKKSFGGIRAEEILRGSSETRFVVILAVSNAEPNKADLQAAWKSRAGQSADPVLVAVSYSVNNQEFISLLGPDRDAIPVSAIERAIAERLIAHALEIDSPMGLHAEIKRRLKTLQTGLGLGFRNEGLFATHVLNQQPNRSDWSSLCKRSAPLLSIRSEALLEHLHYSIEAVPDGVVLRESSGGHRRAAAVLLTEDESFDNPLSRFHGSNAVTHGLALARRESVPWLIVLGGSVARLFPVDPDIGVGRKGQTQTYVEIDLDMLTDATAGFLVLFFSPESLAHGGNVWLLLADSSKYATDLSERLRDRIYQDVIDPLSVAVANKNRVKELPVDLQKSALENAYHQSMIILFRLLFVAYAEDRGLLPFGVNEAYTANALKTLARRILDDPDQTFSEHSTSIWADLVQIWDVIDSGDLEGMGVPAYNGGLFSRDSDKYSLGSAVYDLRLTNDQIGPALRGLLIDITPDGILGLVDFRSLDVREFGTIYEGLLASGLGIANTNLTVDSTDTYVPAVTADTVLVSSGEVYFHSVSGSRKATGSYFTKPFAVQHLLNQALEPAITEHLDRIRSLMEKGATTSAAEALFTFRVADLSMGSAHFLVAAIDRIETRFSEFLIRNPLPEVAIELHSLRTTAARQLGLPVDECGIDDGMLLRRQIARRCIYGIDINEIAVELARLAVWIHTFVPGLPLSFLNHGLIHGNSLTGVGTLEEVVTSIQEAEIRETKRVGMQSSFFFENALQGFLERASIHLGELSALADASIADVALASSIQKSIEFSLQPLAALCDLITAERTTRFLPTRDPNKINLFAGRGDLLTAADASSLEAAVLSHPHLAKARAISTSVGATHIAVAFPEVFHRDRPGFDVILGNPPWEELKIDVSAWWALRFPGLKSLPQGAQDKRISSLKIEHPEVAAEFDDEVRVVGSARHVLLAGPYPGLGSGDPDLYQAFSWRFLMLMRENGRLGVVVPRGLLAASGSTEWRIAAFDTAEFSDVVLLLNSARWAFDMEPRYTIALLSMYKRSGDVRTVSLAGPFHSLEEFSMGVHRSRVCVPAGEFRNFATGSAFPVLNDQGEADVYRIFRRHPRLDLDAPHSWRIRPYREFDATIDKPLFLLDKVKDGYWKLYKGESFNLWNPDTGVYYGCVNPNVKDLLQVKRMSTFGRIDSPITEFSKGVIEDESTLPILNPRIAIRLVARATDTRTLIVCLVPPNTALTNGAPYLLIPRGDEKDVAYLLGLLCSLPLDWLARRSVEINVNHHVINGLTIPRIDLSTGRLLDHEGASGTNLSDYRGLRDRVVEISGRLAAVDSRFRVWAKKVGVTVGTVQTETEREELIAELDALAFILYGLDEGQVVKVFETFQRGWDYQKRLTQTLAQYHSWQKRVVKRGKR